VLLWEGSTEIRGIKEPAGSVLISKEVKGRELKGKLSIHLHDSFRCNHL